MRIARHIGKLEALGLKEGETAYQITLDGTENPEFKEILEGWLDALELHQERSKDYRDRDIFSLGIRGEFVGVWRKMQKLYSSIWKGNALIREGDQEVMMDLMGSLGLMLKEQKRAKDKYGAKWRDNHSNRPTFGPRSAESLLEDRRAMRGDWLAPAEGAVSVDDGGIATGHIGQAVPITGAVMWTGPSKMIKAGDRISGQIVEGPAEHKHVFMGRPSACICGEPSPVTDFQNPATDKGNCSCEVNHPGVPHMHG